MIRSMYDECQQPGVGADGVGRPFLPPWCTLGLWTTGFLWGSIGGKCINIGTPAPGGCPSLLGGTEYCHGVGIIPIEASGSTQVGSFSLSLSIHPTLSVVLAI